RLAQARRTASYDEIASLVAPDARGRVSLSRVSKILNEISVYEHSRSRPMLSALVLNRTRGAPGPEFFALARALGRYDGEDERSDRLFLDAEIESVWAHWGTA
ncbi:MAG TPA: hypothetical protein VF960_07010, partial [Chloroflexota bacterium]